MKDFRISDKLYLVLLLGLLFLSTGKAQSAVNTDPDELDGYAKADALVARVQGLLAQDDFVALESLATQARTTKVRFDDNEWKLFVIYQALTWPKAGERATDLDWEPHLEHLARWFKQSPLSITARVAYGGALLEHAFKARVQGQEWTAVGTEVGGKIFQARLKLAVKVLSDLKKVKERCPHLYHVMLKLAQSQGWSWAEFNIPYAQGIALEPTYHHFYQAKAFYMLPRNHGGQGEWENYADDVYQRLGPKDGALQYFMMVSYLRPYFGQELFTKNRINWLRLKEGYLVLTNEVKGNNLRHNEMAFFAAMAKDQVAAKKAFDLIGSKREVSVWQYQAWFDQKRAWAYDMGGSPMSQASPRNSAVRKN